MANYYASARSNYFAVKNAEDFKEWADSRNLTVIDSATDDGHTLYGVYPDSPDSGGWEQFIYEEGKDEPTEVDLMQELSAHLEEGWVAVILEAGAEKLRYITGYAIAVDSEGRQVGVNLGDIYKLAEKELGGRVVPAEY